MERVEFLILVASVAGALFTSLVLLLRHKEFFWSSFVSISRRGGVGLIFFSFGVTILVSIVESFTGVLNIKSIVLLGVAIGVIEEFGKGAFSFFLFKKPPWIIATRTGFVGLLFGVYESVFYVVKVVMDYSLMGGLVTAFARVGVVFMHMFWAFIFGSGAALIVGGVLRQGVVFVLLSVVCHSIYDIALLLGSFEGTFGFMPVWSEGALFGMALFLVVFSFLVTFYAVDTAVVLLGGQKKRKKAKRFTSFGEL